jgi:hypothetical protein
LPVGNSTFEIRSQIFNELVLGKELALFEASPCI